MTRPANRLLRCASRIASTIVLASSLATAFNAPVLAASANEAGIPGPRTCFWLRGPFSASPYINVAYPDANVFYWSAFFTLPAGASLKLEGQFAHARYQSLISYDDHGRPVESLADYLIQPDKGATNPYRPGAARNASKRGYTVNILSDAAKSARAEGEMQDGATSNQLHAPKFERDQQTLIYRVYAPDEKTAPTGGSDLPVPVLTLADGSVHKGLDACKALNTAQRPAITPDALGIPVDEYRSLLSVPGKPDTWPATIPPNWHIQLDRKSLIGIYTGDISKDARRSEGGFYPNPDNNYVRTIINRKHGQVVILRGKMPTTPHTFHGDKVMSEGQVRYWSICSNKGFANTMVNDCLFDEQVPVDKSGFYTIIVSRAADRPRNARAACGLGWLPMADDGDGVFDKDVTVIQIRNMLAAADFKEAVQRVEQDGTAEKIMGPYLPKAIYSMPSKVEALFPCLDSGKAGH